ncbi:uncharacterized protein MELLADRAFT_108607 [Melampsora larici-populina 98AG31]|uniref:Uncharacterized protein n=1 Tax=Melampsora larici-populina (strain 98AG31 / pathotype 3-4-7) TaxID=747676 RepID=F4RTN3_MELLP|nr:uncharacterized protein MELLADRAFT_108607 [Melampsora larici-populina 98AG31]EGG04288.1 hypothetical protein MELLADRAFT_108607 [Melampsora larici-populina 98AG31]
MPEPTAIEINHQKWINNIKTAALNANTPLYKLMLEGYADWCHEENTPVRRVLLCDLNIEVPAQKVIEKVIEKSTDTSTSKNEYNTMMIEGEDKRLAEQAEKDAKNFGDYNYMDNPFVFGGPFQNMNPLDGKMNPTWDTMGTTIDNNAELLTGRGLMVWGNHSVSAFQSEVAAVNTSQRPTCYLGNRFDPLYHEKKKARNQPYPNSHHHQTYPDNNHQNNTQTYYSNPNHLYQRHNDYQYNHPSNFHQPRGGPSNGNRGGGRGGRGRGRGRPGIGPGSFNRLMIEPTSGGPEVTTPGPSGS